MIKFLKKFKDKILIALACSFIGIGTIFSNTLVTKAYTSDTFSNTLISETYNNTTYYKIDSNFEYTRYNFVLLNFTSNSNGNWTIDLNLYDSSFNLIRYNRQSASISSSNVNFYYFVDNLSNASYIRITTGASNFTLVNLDYVNSNDLTTTYYAQTYIDNYTNLQSQYDSLLLDYQNYTNTHAYTNEQYNNLMSQNATLTQQVQALQSQYDTYVSLHSYTNTQYETLLNNYNNLQTLYNSLQQQYLDLQQRYNELNLLLSPFIDNVWTRSATLNGTTIDISSMSYHNNIVSFNGTYLEIYPYDMDIYSSYIQGENDFQMIATSSSTITIGNYTAIAPLSHSLGDGFSIEFYLDSTIVYSSTWFDNDMTASDGSSSTDTFNSIVPITFNRFILNLQASTGTSGFTSYSYFKATTGSFNDGYNYAVEQLQPRINILEDSLEQAINQQQVRYSEGYNAGFDSRIIHNLYTE